MTTQPVFKEGWSRELYRSSDLMKRLREADTILWTQPKVWLSAQLSNHRQPIVLTSPSPTSITYRGVIYDSPIVNMCVGFNKTFPIPVPMLFVIAHRS